MAAGIGKRMQPVTHSIPKPLIAVNGVRMIDTVIQGLRSNGIEEIAVVVGYLKEQFANLTLEYPGLKLIENPWYESRNNISSLYEAREYLEDVIILDGDQVVYNNEILSPEFERSGYNAIWQDSGTEEWLMEINEDGKVISCSRTGGEKGWQLFSVSRWNAEDGKRLRRYLEFEYEVKNNYQVYWDDIALFLHPEEFALGIWPMQWGDIVEIDNFSELCAIDKRYEREWTDEKFTKN